MSQCLPAELWAEKKQMSYNSRSNSELASEVCLGQGHSGQLRMHLRAYGLIGWIGRKVNPLGASQAWTLR